MKFYKGYSTLISLMFYSSIFYNRSVHWHPIALKANTKDLSLHALQECFYISSPFYHHSHYLKLLFQAVLLQHVWYLVPASGSPLSSAFRKTKSWDAYIPLEFRYLNWILTQVHIVTQVFHKQENYFIQALLENYSQKHILYIFENNILFSLNSPL